MLTSSRVRTARVSSLVGALLLLRVSPAAAIPEEPAAASARLEVQSIPECTTREELSARVASRSRRIHFNDEKAVGPTVRAMIAPAPHGGAVAELVIVQADGRSSSRRLSAPSCAEAADAIALIIALTLDPLSAAASGTAGHPGPAALPPSARQTASLPPQPTATEPARAAPKAATARPGGPSRSTEVRSSSVAEREPSIVASRPAPAVATQRRLRGGATAQAIFGLAPGALPGFGFYLSAAVDREALWSPAVVIAGTHAWSSGLVEPGGTAAFTLDALTLDACPLRLHLVPLEARACGTALYGRLGAAGSDTYSPAVSARPFAAAGGALLLSLTLGRLLELSGRFGASASLIRDSFAFTPAVFHRTAAVTVAAGLGLGVRFP
jgi:hypothetical protein